VASIFISYDTDEGLDHAREAKLHLEKCGHSAWVWHLDRRVIGYKQIEMAKAVDSCDYFLLICTQATSLSQAQTYEREMAWQCNKIPPLLVTFSGEHVPFEWRCYHYNDASGESIETQCARICEELRNQQELKGEAVTVSEGAPVIVNEVAFGIDAVLVEKAE